MRGQYAHNTKVWFNENVFDPDPNIRDGGWRGYNGNGYENDNVATRLKAAGYCSGLFGKYLNGYGATTVPTTPGVGRLVRVQEGWLLRLRRKRQQHHKALRHNQRRLFHRLPPPVPLNRLRQAVERLPIPLRDIPPATRPPDTSGSLIPRLRRSQRRRQARLDKRPEAAYYAG
jgi:arylsulfatase A-like enzyme